MPRFLLIPLLVSGLLLAQPAVAQSLPPLLQAIKDNELPQVETLLKAGADIKTADSDSDNVLMYAALYSTVDCMQLLLQKGADPNAKNKLGETAILWCTHDLQKTKLLLDHKADVNSKTTTGNTAFLAACVGPSQTEMIRLMLQHGADPLVRNNRKSTSLMQVAQFGDTVAAKLLLGKGVDINAKGPDGFTALHLAIKLENKNMVYWLLRQGADPDAHDDYRATPLGYAVLSNDLVMVKTFIPLTNAINEQDIDSTTALMWATYHEYDNPDIIRALLDAGASVAPKDKKGQTVLDWALKKGNTATVEVLKKAGAVSGKTIK